MSQFWLASLRVRDDSSVARGPLRWEPPHSGGPQLLGSLSSQLTASAFKCAAFFHVSCFQAFQNVMCKWPKEKPKESKLITLYTRKTKTLFYYFILSYKIVVFGDLENILKSPVCSASIKKNNALLVRLFVEHTNPQGCSGCHAQNSKCKHLPKSELKLPKLQIVLFP